MVQLLVAWPCFVQLLAWVCFLGHVPMGFSLDEAGGRLAGACKAWLTLLLYCGYSKRTIGSNLKPTGNSSKWRGGTSWMASRGKGNPLWRSMAGSFNWRRLTEMPEGMIFSRTGLCSGVSITIWSCGRCCCAVPAGNLLWVLDVLFVCVYSQVLRCVASAC